METSMWNETLLLDSSWGLDLPFHQEDGLFGDLKPDIHVDGADLLSFQPQDAAEHSTSIDAVKEEDGLGMEWMESSDLSMYLGELGSGDAKFLPLDSSLHEFASLITPEQPVAEDQKDDKAGLVIKTPNVVLASEIPVSASIGFDALLSPPESPEQVAPVIQLHPVPAKGRLQQNVLYSNSVADDTSAGLPASDDFFIDELEFLTASQVYESPVFLDEAQELISSPLSADDVDSMFFASAPASPTSSISNKSSSIIETSPELYKVISTTSLEVPKRFSPYQKSKPPKATPRRRAPAQPVPEHIISGQLNKKDRKKLQNKNAAIRYRQKKKEEAVGITTEEQQLEEYNTELKTKVEDLEREIKYMKNLMEDVLKAKGLI